MKRPIATIAISVLAILVTMGVTVFDSSIYGVNGDPTEWLSFAPAEPFRHFSLSLIVSPFLHLNLEHLLMNLIFFIPVGMMMERKRSTGFLLSSFLLIHFQVLFGLVLTHPLYSLEGAAFLGMSHVVIGLYTLWALTNKKYGMLFITVLIIVAGLWQSQSPLTILAHGLGLFMGAELLVLRHLIGKLRPKGTN